MAISNGAPATPHIKCEDVTYMVRWGWMGKSFILALAAMIGISGTMVWRVEASEADVETLKENVQVLNRNLGKIDEKQRISEARDRLLVKQMNALLKANDVTERIEAPPVKPSTLEDLKTE